MEKSMKKISVLVCLLAMLFPGFAHAQTLYGRIQTDRIANKQTIIITGATPNVSSGNVFKTNNGGPITITNFLGGVDSQVITVNCGETDTTIQNNANIVTTSGADILCTVNKAQDFTFDGAQAKWIQKSGRAGAGCTPLGVNALQKNNSGSCAGSNETDDGTTFSSVIDSQFKGPNPHYDRPGDGPSPSFRGLRESRTSRTACRLVSRLRAGNYGSRRGLVHPLESPLSACQSPDNGWRLLAHRCLA